MHGWLSDGLPTAWLQQPQKSRRTRSQARLNSLCNPYVCFSSLTLTAQALHNAIDGTSTIVREPLPPPDLPLPPLPASISHTVTEQWSSQDSASPSATETKSSQQGLPTSVCDAYDSMGCGAALDVLSSWTGVDYRQLPAMQCAPGSAGGCEKESAQAVEVLYLR